MMDVGREIRQAREHLGHEEREARQHVGHKTLKVQKHVGYEARENVDSMKHVRHDSR